MSTRSNIGYIKDDKLHFIYCHHDGYIEGVGITLLSHYNTLEKVKELVEGGDISSLGKQYDDKPTTVYHRDLGEDFEDTKPQVSSMKNTSCRLPNGFNEDYGYIYDSNIQKWFYNRWGGSFHSMT